MSKKIVIVSLFFSMITLITYKNFIYTASTPAQIDRFEELFNLIKQQRGYMALKIMDDREEPIDTLRGSSDETILHRAAEFSPIPSFIEMVINRNINPNVQDKYKQTPLMYAIRAHNVPAVKILLQVGADPSIKDVHNQTALDAAKHYKSRFEMIGPYGIGMIGPVDPATFKSTRNDFDTIIDILQKHQNN